LRAVATTMGWGGPPAGRSVFGGPSKPHASPELPGPSFKLMAPRATPHVRCCLLYAPCCLHGLGRGVGLRPGLLPHQRRCIWYRPWHVGGWPAGLWRVRRLTTAATVERPPSSVFALPIPCPMLHAPCSMPHARCPMLDAPRGLLSSALCPPNSVIHTPCSKLHASCPHVFGGSRARCRGFGFKEAVCAALDFRPA
jgi:hypothetical protein